MRRTATEECCALERFRDWYARGTSSAQRAVQIAGIGADVGATGYTTIMQASELARKLKLTSSSLVLDVGCGRGHPGRYLAQVARCRVVGADLPLASLKWGLARANRDRIGRKMRFVAASGVHLPFRPASFDAVVHTDLLCCLRAKVGLLRACADALKPGGVMAFTTIYIAPGVSERDYQRASRIRGRGAACRRSTGELLTAAGFVAIRERDVTREFARTTRAYVDAVGAHEDALRREWGQDVFRQSSYERRATLGLIEQGILKRGLYVARRPIASSSS